MMKFREVKTSIIDILGAAEDLRYKTVGFQRQTEGADEINELPQVVVYYSGGQFHKSAAGITGPVQHDCTFTIEISVAEAAKVDLTVLNNTGSTAATKKAALNAMIESAALADLKWDETFDNVFQVLMDARNIDMGLTPGQVADRWVDQPQKDQPLPQGEYVLLTGRATLTLSVEEEVPGDTGIDGVAYDNSLNIEGDPNENAGTAGTLGG